VHSPWYDNIYTHNGVGWPEISLTFILAHITALKFRLPVI
jgi:hypothetical protein